MADIAPREARVKVPDVWVVHTASDRMPPDARGLGLLLEKEGVFYEVSSLENLSFDAALLPRLILLLADHNDGITLRAIEHLQRRLGSSAPQIAVFSNAPSLDLRIRGFLKGAAGFVSRDLLKTRNDIYEQGVLPQEAREIGLTRLDEWVGYCTDSLRNNIMRTHAYEAQQSADEVHILLGDGRNVATTLASFIEGITSYVAGHVHSVSKARPIADVHGTPREPVSRKLPYEGARFVVAMSSPVRCDLLAKELRSKGGWVVVCDHQGNDIERFAHIDPHAVFVDADDQQEADAELPSLLTTEPRLRWASLVVIQWEVFCPFDEVDSPLLERQIIPLLAPERTFLAEIREQSEVQVDMESLGPCRILRALKAQGGEWKISAGSVHSSCSVRLCDELVVRAEAEGWDAGTSRPTTFEGISALSAWILMKGGLVHVERSRSSVQPNVVMPLDEALFKAYGAQSTLVRVMDTTSPKPFVHEASGTVRVMRPAEPKAVSALQLDADTPPSKDMSVVNDPSEMAEGLGELLSRNGFWKLDEDLVAEFFATSVGHADPGVQLAVQLKWGLAFFGTLIMTAAGWMFWSMALQRALLW